MSTQLDNFVIDLVIREIVPGKDVASVLLFWHGRATNPSIRLQVIP